MQTLHSLCLVKYTKLYEHVIGGDIPCFRYKHSFIHMICYSQYKEVSAGRNFIYPVNQTENLKVTAVQGLFSLDNSAQWENAQLSVSDLSSGSNVLLIFLKVFQLRHKGDYINLELNHKYSFWMKIVQVRLQWVMTTYLIIKITANQPPVPVALRIRI